MPSLKEQAKKLKGMTVTSTSQTVGTSADEKKFQDVMNTINTGILRVKDQEKK